MIDGCNFIKFFEDGPDNFEACKIKLISRVQSYIAAKQVGCTIVFDSQRPSREKVGKVQVIHTRDADRKIIEEIEKRNSPASVTVVTNDNGLKGAAKSLRAKSMPVGDFDNFLSKKTHPKTHDNCGREKPSPEGMTRKEVRRWKKELGLS